MEVTGLPYESLGNLTYSYDLAGRRTNVGGSFARTGMLAAVTNANYNADNQQTSFGTANLSYDANGNLLSDGANTYTWNPRNELSAISGPVTASFQYDAFGRRIGKTIGATTTQYLYDGVNPVEELSGGTGSATMLTGLGVDEYFQRTDSSGTFDYLSDALGSTVALAGPAGALGAQYTYEPFGNATVSGSSFNPFRFTDREDDGTGLDFYRLRYYSQTLGRFISEDPARLVGGINFYAYARNDPLNFSDAFGLGPDSAPHGCKTFGPPGEQHVECGLVSPDIDPVGVALTGPVGGAEDAAEQAVEDIAGDVLGETAAEDVVASNGVDIGEKAFNHVIEGHTVGGADTVGNSIFSGDAQDVANLIQNSQTENGVLQANGNTAYVNYASKAVGYSPTGQYTNVYTVIVNQAGELVTAFPGIPGRP